MALVYSYIRFSSKKQEMGQSLRRQLERGEEWIRRNGHTPATKQLLDLGKSGYHARHIHSADGKLGEFLRMIEEGRLEPGSILLVEHLDRLSREGMDPAGDIMKKIIRAGVLIAVIKPAEKIYDKETLKDPLAFLEPLMAFHLAYQESKRKADLLKDVWDKKRKNLRESGTRFNNKLPQWLSLDDNGKVVVNEEIANSIRYIFEATCEGKGQRQILKVLQNKHKSKSYSGVWNSSYISRVVNDIAVTGKLQPMGISPEKKRVAIGSVINDYYPRIISEELFDRAQSAKAANVKRKGPNSGYINLFTGLVFNAVDGSALHMQTTRGPRKGQTYVQRRLVSYSHRNRLNYGHGVTVPYYELEAMVLRHMKELRLEDLTSREGVSALRAKEQELTGVELRLRRLEQDIAEADSEEYTTLRNAAKINRDKKKQILKELDTLKADLSADNTLNTAKGIINALDNTYHGQYSGMSTDQLRTRLRSLIGEFVESIYIKPEKHYGRVYTMVQINYRNGLVRQFGWGPGWVQKVSGAVSDKECFLFNFDLRDKEASKGDKLAKIAKMLTAPAPAPDETKIPAGLNDAAELFIRVLKSKLQKESYKTVPSKIRRFSAFIGDRPTNTINKTDWEQFKRHLKNMVGQGQLGQKTAQVCYNRCRELLQWLQRHGIIKKWDLGGSAVKEVGK